MQLSFVLSEFSERLASEVMSLPPLSFHDGKHIAQNCSERGRSGVNGGAKLRPLFKLIAYDTNLIHFELPLSSCNLRLPWQRINYPYLHRIAAESLRIQPLLLG